MTYDGLGVIILPCRQPGKFKAQRIAVVEGQVTVLAELTENRDRNSAHRVASDDFQVLKTDLTRNKYSLREPEQLRLKFEQ